MSTDLRGGMRSDVAAFAALPTMAAACGSRLVRRENPKMIKASEAIGCRCRSQADR
jgi:hypothetical protein